MSIANETTMSNIKKIKVESVYDLNKLKDEITENWLKLQNTSSLFRYKLNIQKQKILPGNYKFVVELNSERSALRRAPQTIHTVVADFNENAFNFNKVNAEEILFECNHPKLKAIVTYLINNSPLTKYHSLICPDLRKNLPQVLTRDAITIAIDTLADFRDPKFKIGYNSPGALASVNHLHLHLLHMDEPLYVDHPSSRLQHLIGDVFKLKGPIKGYFLNIVDWSNYMRRKLIDAVNKLTRFLCTENIPHNVFFTYEGMGCREVIRIFIFPRNQVCDVKEFTSYNIACCELAGFIHAGLEGIYNALTEESILEKIKNEIGEVPNLDEKIIALFSGEENV